MNSEFIAAAAIQFENGLIMSVPQPGRHHSVFQFSREVFEASEPARLAVARAEQGFVTTTGRFVTRSEGFQIARSAGQLKRVHVEGCLFSEDMW